MRGTDVLEKNAVSRNQTLHAALLALELRLLDPAVRKNRAAVDALLAEEFEECGRSGRRYDKTAILDLLAGEDEEATTLEQFRAVALGEAAALATYRTVDSRGAAWRSSVWVWRAGRWVMLYHQGTAAV